VYPAETSRKSDQRLEPILRVGLIGVTGYAHSYFEGLGKLVDDERLRWGAVTIINPEEAVEQVKYFRERGVAIYTDYTEMLDKERKNLDWVGIPTGIGWHRKMLLDCLERGIPALVEKPLVPTLQEVALIREAEERTGLSVAVGYQHIYIDETWEIKKRLLDGEIGEIQRIDALGLWPRARSYYERARWSGRLHDGNSWILDSPLHNALSHIVNLILFFSGKEWETRAKLKKVNAELYRAKSIESFDTIRTEVELEGGIPAAMILSHACQHELHPEIRITGSLGSLHWRFKGFHTFFKEMGITSIQSPDNISIRETMFAGVVNHFEGKSAKICNTTLAAGTTEWVNAVHDTAPIIDIPDCHRLRIQPEDGEIHDVIRDIEYYALRAYLERKSFLEVGAPWAVSARERSLEDYVSFEGRYCPEAKHSGNKP